MSHWPAKYTCPLCGSPKLIGKMLCYDCEAQEAALDQALYEVQDFDDTMQD